MRTNQDLCPCKSISTLHHLPATNHYLRGILIDDRPWFVASDLARLLAMDYPQTLARRVEPYEVQEVRLLSASGAELSTEIIYEAALYNALIRFGHRRTAR